MPTELLTFMVSQAAFRVPNNYASPRLQDLFVPDFEKLYPKIIYVNRKKECHTGEINPFVSEIWPSGSSKRRGHSLADGTYLTKTKKGQ